jgi:hypothetical protein
MAHDHELRQLAEGQAGKPGSNLGGTDKENISENVAPYQQIFRGTASLTDLKKA